MPDLLYILVDYSLNKEKFLKNFNVKKEEDPEFNFLEITEIPSAQKGLELISQEWFKSILQKHKNLSGINLRINEKVDENFKDQPHFFEFQFREYFIISFQSSIEDCESMTYWKVSGREKFYSTFIDNDVDENFLPFFHEFLIEQFEGEFFGVMKAFKDKNEIRLHELGTDSNSNLLMTAALWGNLEAVQQLVTREFDVDYENDEKEVAIDKSWSRFIGSDKENQEGPESIILCLLNANSVFPKDFNYDKASQKIKDFVDISEGLFRDIKKGNFETLNIKMKEHPNLIYYYNRKNKSLLLHALETKRFQIIDYLESGLNAGAHEALDFFEGYKESYKNDLESLRKQHKLNAKELPKTYLLVLRSKTKIGNNDQLTHIRRRNVEEAFDILDKNNFCSLLLQVTAQVKSIKIFFDFKHDSVYYLDPMKKITVLGTTYSGGTMYIGAKQLLDDSTKHIVLSTLSHELCHLAVLVTYMNPNFDPFPLGESEIKEMFMNEVMTESREKMKNGDIVSNAFGYVKELQASELIVTVAEALMHFYNDPRKIEEVEGIHEKLFKYAKEVVEPEMKEALPVLRKLGDLEINIRYDSLTTIMKQSISHMPINLQGVNTTFYELFGHDDSCQKLLSPDNIRDLLLTGKGLKISEMCTLDLKYELIKRNFIDRAAYLKLKASPDYKYKPNIKEKSKPIMDIREDIKQSKFFILADYAGTGKTTMFRDSAIRIKTKETKCWVSYINLRKFETIFQNYEGKLKDLSPKDVGDILLQILKILDKKLEREIFLNLLKRSQVVLLFDGVDEICPRHTEILMKTFEALKKHAGFNEFWISTRPHYAARIMEIFGVSPITFVLYTQEQKVEFITEILTKNGITSKIEQTNAIGQINAFIFHLNWVPGFYSDPDHPLIIEIITEIYVEKREIKLDASSHYALYAAMIDKQKEKVGDKIPNVERDPFSSLSVWHAHQVLAILVIIGELYDMAFNCTLPDGTEYREGFEFTLEGLSIIEAWRRERKSGRWTSDMIQRYGFVTVNLDELMEDRSCIDFSHRTYAEFFVAQFLIDFLFNNNFNEDEMVKMMKMVQMVQGTPALGNVGQFIFSFIKTVARKENRKFHPLIRLYFIKRIKQSVAKLELEPLVDGQDPFIFFGKIMACDDELVDQLWGLNDEVTSFQKIINGGQLKNLELVLDTANFILGDDWHERLNKSPTKLISRAQIEAMRDTVVESWDDWKKDKDILKFCDFLHKNFDSSVQRRIHDEKINVFHIGNNKVRVEVIKIMSDIYDKDTFIDKCLKEMYFTDFTGDCLEFIINKVEELLNNDREAVRKLLFEDLQGDKSLLYKAIISRSPGVLPVVQKYYLKYQDSIKEVQDILIEIETSEIFKSAIESKTYPEFKSFIEDTFKDQMDTIKEKIETFLANFYEAANEETIKNIDNFIYFLFTDGEDKSKADELLDNVDVQEPSVDYGYEDPDWSDNDDNNEWNKPDDYDDNDYVGDTATDIVLKKVRKLGESAAEGTDISYLFPESFKGGDEV